MPSINRDWSYTEYQQILEDIVAKQKTSDYQYLTFKNNSQLLLKLTEYQNYWFFDSEFLPLNERIIAIANITKLVITIMLNYYKKSTLEKGKLTYEKEIASFFQLSLKISKATFTLSEEYVRENPKLTEQQTQSLQQMIRGASGTIAGSLQTLENEYSYFSEGSICLMGSNLKEFYMVVSPKLNNDVKSEFDKRITKIAQSHKIECLREIFKTK
jgi:hypothetical protein